MVDVVRIRLAPRKKLGYPARLKCSLLVKEEKEMEKSTKTIMKPASRTFRQSHSIVHQLAMTLNKPTNQLNECKLNISNV